MNDDPEFHARLEDLGESVTFWKSLKLRNEDVDKKHNCDNIEYSSDRESRKDTEFECPVYPGIVNVDSRSKDNSEEQYMFIQNPMHTQELDNDEDDKEYDRDGCASSDHELGKCKSDDEEYESDCCDNSDDENGGHKMMTKSMRWIMVILVTMMMKMEETKWMKMI